MSTLYLRLPSKAAAGNAPHWPALPCPFALVSNSSMSHDTSIERQGVMPLQDLSDTIAKAQRVVLLLAAGDVTLLRVKVPPLSPSRMKAALPNLVEDRLISDPSDCVVVAGGMADGMRTVAVVQRSWLDALVKALVSCGARKIAALPAQLCLSCQLGQPNQPDQPVSVAVAGNEPGNAIDMTFRLSEHDGIGVAISANQNESAAHEIIRTLCAIVPDASIVLHVPQSEIHAYQEVVNHTGALNKRISILADNWSRWISGANGTTLDLMGGLGAGSHPSMDWRAWRWPLALAATVLITNVAALNIDWWRMKSEASALRATMTQIYKSSFPKETVIIDPAAQMRQKIATIKHDAGLSKPDDFTAITASFGEAWASVTATSGKPPAIAVLEYRERSLFVRFKPVLSRTEAPNAEAPMRQMKVALAERHLSLDQETSGAAAVWKIRSAK